MQPSSKTAFQKSRNICKVENGHICKRATFTQRKATLWTCFYTHRCRRIDLIEILQSLRPLKYSPYGFNIKAHQQPSKDSKYSILQHSGLYYYILKNHRTTSCITCVCLCVWQKSPFFSPHRRSYSTWGEHEHPEENISSAFSETNTMSFSLELEPEPADITIVRAWRHYERNPTNVSRKWAWQGLCV